MNARHATDCLLLAACLALTVVLVAYAEGPNSWTGKLGVIAIIGQVLTVAMLAALRRGSVVPLIVLFLASLAGGGLISLVAERQTWAMFSTVLMMAAVAVYVTARFVSAKYFTLLPREGRPTPVAMRFSIARIMIWTAIIAAILALIRNVQFDRADAVFIPWFVLVSTFGLLAGGIAILGHEIPAVIRGVILWGAVMIGFVLIAVVPDADFTYGAIIEAWLLLATVRLLQGKRKAMVEEMANGE